MNGKAGNEKRRLFSSRPSPNLAKSVFSAYALTPSENWTDLTEKAECKQSKNKSHPRHWSYKNGLFLLNNGETVSS